MISKELEKKVDQTVASTIVSQELNQPATDLAEDPGIPNSTDAALVEQLEAPVDPQQDFPSVVEVPDEPIQVAGLGSVVTKLKEATKAAEARVLPPLPDRPVIELSEGLLVRQATQEEMDTFVEATGGVYTKGINFPAIAEGMEQFDLAAHLAKVKDANKELFETQRRGVLNFDSLMELATSQGMDGVVHKWLTREPGTAETAEKVLAGLIAYQGVSMEALRLSQEVAKMAPGPEKTAALAEWHKIATVEAVLAANVSGAGSEYGRGLYMLAQAQKQLQVGDVESRAGELMRLFGAENAEDIEYIHHLYMGLPNPRARAEFARQGFFSKSMDVITEVWINSILSSPVTHMVNIAGNGIFYATRTAENVLAAGIGSVRSRITGNSDRVRAREALIDAHALVDTFGDALLVAGKTFIQEAPQNPGTKIDVRNQRAIGSTGNLLELFDGGIVQSSVNVLGVAARGGGRFLLAEDEFFKAIGYRASLRKQAYYKGAEAYDAAIAAGKTPDEALQIQSSTTVDILTNPQNHQDIVKTAQDAAKELTFQTDLEGRMGALQGLFSHPALKIFVPFFKTPTNVINEVMKRTPLALAYPSVRSALASGGREADIATSKIALGSMIMGYFGYQAVGASAEGNGDVVIVGAGPTDYAKKQAYDRMGLYPYTINFKIKEGPDKGKYQSWTYSRLDPISGLLAMAADFANYSQYEEDPASLSTLAMHGALSMYQYATQMPFLQGVAELSEVMRAPDPGAQFEALVAKFAQKGTEAGLSLVPGNSSFWAGVGRLGDPTARSSMLPATGDIAVPGTDLTFSFADDPAAADPMTRGFYTALQRMRSRNPMFNDDLPPRLNLWGEEMQVGTGAGWEFVSPIRVRTSKYDAIDKELIRLGGGIKMPDKKIKGVLMNAEEYNDLILTMNNADFDSGDVPLFEGDPGFNPGNTLKPSLMRTISSEEYLAMDKTQRLEELNRVVEMHRKNARESIVGKEGQFGSNIKLSRKVLEANAVE